MHYLSTRGNYHKSEAAEAISLGMVPGGGLFVPESFPQYFPQNIGELSYRELAQNILEKYLSDYSPAELAQMVDAAYYGGNFDEQQAPVVKIDKAGILELWHGPTAAFKDMALQLMPHLLVAAVKKMGGGRDTAILVATSGDTGKAALEGFSDVPGVKIIVFYPVGGVSRVQELQMLTTEGENTAVVGVFGNFDDCQTAVKKIFGDEQMKKRLDEGGYQFSSANSINWGRLLPQIVYYYHGYAQMVAQGKIKVGDEITVVVPTGNFGNILAGYYAKKMGLPIGKLVCASNQNNVLTDAIEKGFYDRRRPFYRTTSPSMDILVSSNFERFMFELLGRDGQKCAELYKKLDIEGVFELDASAKKVCKDVLWGGWASENEVAATIGKVYQNEDYLLDPHTAVAVCVYDKYQAATGDNKPCLIVSTASPYKFPAAVLEALGQVPGPNAALHAEQLATFVDGKVHRALAGVNKKQILHDRQSEVQNLPAVVAEILGV